MLRVALAFIRVSFYEQTSQGLVLFMRTGAFVLALATQAFLGRLVDAAPNPKLGSFAGHYTAFLVLGFAVLDLQHAVVAGLSTKIREAQRYGTLELMLTSPTSVAKILVGMVAPDVGGALVRMFLYILLALVFYGAGVSPTTIGEVVLVVLAGVIGFSGLGLMGAALTMILRRADPIAWVVGTSSVIVGGVLYPRNVLPGALAWFGQLLPLSPVLDGVRGALAGSVPLGALVHIAVMAIVSVPVGVFLFQRALRHARIEGSLTAY